jgi:hypothetical protein
MDLERNVSGMIKDHIICRGLPLVSILARRQIVMNEVIRDFPRFFGQILEL